MDFFLTEEQQTVRQAIREFVDKEIAPHAAEYDRTGEFPHANVKKLGENGWLNLHMPEQYGGSGLDYLTYTIVIEEIARGCAATATIYDVQCTLFSEAVLNYGTDAQKQQYLPAMTSGTKIGAYALTEPGAGSNPAGMRSRAERTADGYVLNGQKTFITNGDVADAYLVFANLNPEAGHRGITAFIVDKGTPGLSAGKAEEKMGIRASHTTDVFLDNVKVPESARLGAEGEGLKIALNTLDGGRIGIGAQALGILQAAYDKASAYAKEREQFGQKIGLFQAVQWKLADMLTDLEAARLLLYRAAFLKAQGRPVTQEAAMAKLFCSEKAMKHTTQAVQIFGGYGYMAEYGVERLMRDAKITEIYEGTSEIQRLVIGRAIMRG